MINLQADKKNNLDEGEISLPDIMCFLKTAWKVIAIFGLIGVAISITYLSITPKQYEATVQITMAQISAESKNFNPRGAIIEEPSVLIARLSSPTSFSDDVIEACDLHDQADAAVVPSKVIKLSIPKGLEGVVDLKTLGPSPKVVKACAQSVFDLIKSTQAQILAPYIDEAKAKLANYEGRLESAKNLLAKADKSGQAIGASYLSTRDEIRFLLDDIAALKNVISSNEIRATRLIAPIYASDTPIAPKKRVALAGGLLGGLFLGLLVAIGRQIVANTSLRFRGRRD